MSTATTLSIQLTPLRSGNFSSATPVPMSEITSSLLQACRIRGRWATRPGRIMTRWSLVMSLLLLRIGRIARHQIRRTRLLQPKRCLSNLNPKSQAPSRYARPSRDLRCAIADRHPVNCATGNPKIQEPNPKEFSIPNFQKTDSLRELWILVLWSLFGIWCLGFGAFSLEFTRGPCTRRCAYRSSPSRLPE